MPASPAAPAGSLCPAAETPPRPRGTILIIEDDELVASLFGLLVAPLAARVLRARDATEGQRLFEQDPGAIALVVVDCGLPDVPGGTLCRRLRAIAPGLPVLLTSGREHPELRCQLAADGPVDFLAKPYRPAEATQRVRALLTAKLAA